MSEVTKKRALPTEKRKTLPAIPAKAAGPPSNSENSTAAAHETAALAVIDTRAERKSRLLQETKRLVPMAALAAAVFTVLSLACFLLERAHIWQISLAYEASIESYALRSILYLGLIPLATISAMVAVFRPSADYVLGFAPDYSIWFSAPLTGFLIGSLIWCAARFLATFNTAADRLLATPAIWEIGIFHIGKTPLSTVVTLLVSVLLPAASLELLARGLVQPAITSRAYPAIAGVITSVLYALSFFDKGGLLILIFWGVLAFWVRLMTNSLFASALTSASYALAMLFARSISASISQLLFRMPLIETSKLRVFLVMCSLILVVLLLIPLSFIHDEGRRLRAGKKPRGSREKETQESAHYVLWAVICFCIGVFTVLLFFN